MSEKFFIDDRGTFCDIKGDTAFDIKRTYVCKNFQKGTIRGFHYHQHESKLFYVPQGAIRFIVWKMNLKCAQYLHTKIDGGPSKKSVKFDSQIQVIILSESRPSTLIIPKGYANGWQTLTDNAILVGCSDRTLEESVNDDIRINPDLEMFKTYWEVKNR